MKRTMDDPQGFLDRVRPHFRELFRVAHAITGNAELAEFVLQSAILEAYLCRNEWRDRMDVRSGLLHAVRAVGLKELEAIRREGSYEEDFAAEPPVEEKLLGQLIERENAETWRMLLLRYGCALSSEEIARVMQCKTAYVKKQLAAFQTRLTRVARVSEKALGDALRRYLARAGEDVPDMGAVFRSFERDVFGKARRRVSVGSAVGVLLCAVGALLCMALFWVLAILMEPRTEANAAVGEVAVEQASALSEAPVPLFNSLPERV